ncbi:hypothetical protein [Alloactinosynnema sp. L-07]|uniref:hypothetical protein n=1 Tax=Alloactinosynnema sp. L-07 TaxID=1653480 RepID=UPI0012FA85E2|nr:hypothetical protein [Alloactinosynnema sp. L-07]
MTKLAALVAFCVAVGFVSVAAAILLVDVVGLAGVAWDVGMFTVASALAIGAGQAWPHLPRCASTILRVARPGRGA